MLFHPEKIQWETLFVRNLRESPESELVEAFKGMYSASAHLHPLSVPNRCHSGCWSPPLQHRGRWWDPPQDTHTPGTMGPLQQFLKNKVFYRWRRKTQRGEGTTRNPPADRLRAAVLPIDPSNSNDPELQAAAAPPGSACTVSKMKLQNREKIKKTHYRDKMIHFRCYWVITASCSPARSRWNIADIEWRVLIGNLYCWNTNVSF